MKREEEIEKEARRVSRGGDEYSSFILGAEWADETMIEKAIDILIDMSNDGYLIDIHNHEEFEKQFKKIMEE